MDVSQQFRDFVRSQGTYLLENGTNEYALSKSNALIALQLLEQGEAIVLGGDVLHFHNGRFRYGPESWYYSIKEKGSKNSVRESIKTASDYITRFPDPEDETVFYVLVVAFDHDHIHDPQKVITQNLYDGDHLDHP